MCCSRVLGVATSTDRFPPFLSRTDSPPTSQEEQGKIVMAGAFSEPADGALYIFKNVTKEEIDDYIKGDPYYKNGLINGYKIKAWTVVVP